MNSSPENPTDPKDVEISANMAESTDNETITPKETQHPNDQVSINNGPVQTELFGPMPVDFGPVAQEMHEMPSEDYGSSSSIDIDNFELPSTYNDNSLVLMSRDPQSVHAYWDVSPPPDASSLPQEKNNTSSNVLRMYDITGTPEFDGTNARSNFDVEISQGSTSAEISLPYDNAAFCGELGTIIADGSFSSLSRSNSITTPRAAVGSRPSYMLMAALKNPGPPSEQVILGLQQNSPAATTNFVPMAQDSTQNTEHTSDTTAPCFYLTAEELKAWYQQQMPIANNIAHIYSFLDDNPEVVLNVHSEVIDDGSWLSRKYYYFLMHADAQGGLATSSSDMLQVGSSEREQKPQQFFFELATELIVYGRTEPDAQVMFGGIPVNINADGTFSLRFALPEGTIPIDMSAHSADGQEHRRIATSASRKFTENY